MATLADELLLDEELELLDNELELLEELLLDDELELLDELLLDDELLEGELAVPCHSLPPPPQAIRAADDSEIAVIKPIFLSRIKLDLTIYRYRSCL